MEIQPTQQTSMENRTFNPVIQPNIPEPEQKPEFTNETLGESSMDLKEVEVMAYFGVDAGNIEEMEKVSEISEYLKGKELTLDEIDLRLGNPYNQSRLEKIYQYIRLQKHSDRVRQQDHLLQREIKKYDNAL